jgi:predicted DNA-binding transcriptional regulator AlpA
MPAERILQLPRPDAQPVAEANPPGRSAPPSIAPEQVSAADAAAIAGVGGSTWWRLHSAGRVPKPNKLGGKTLWRVQELRDWISAGCPDRRTWEAMKATRERR